MKEMFLYIDGQTVGPYALTFICAKVETGELPADTLYFNSAQELKPICELQPVQVAFKKRNAEPLIAMIVRALAFLAAIGFFGYGLLYSAVAKSAMHETTAGVFLVGGVLVGLVAVVMPAGRRG